jgi:FtsH-binding integral membrane protein
VSSIHIDRARQESPSKSERPASDLSRVFRVLGTTLRAAFIICLLVVTVRVSMPQNETIRTAYDTPADLVRLVLGFAVCLWLAFQLFRTPKDAQSHRMWTYFGLIGVPFAIICLIATW